MERGWFKKLMNDQFFHKNSVNSCLCMNHHKKCLPLEPDLEDMTLAQWLGEYASLTMELKETIVELIAAWHAENLKLGTTWNDVAKQSQEKCKLHSLPTEKTVASHPEQVPSLLKQVNAPTSP